MSEKSKFVLTLDNAADEINRRPNLKGEYKLSGEATLHSLALWGNVSPKTGAVYARGKAAPEGVAEAIAAKSNVQDVPAPSGIDLKVGEAVLFQNASATPDNKQPNFYGYAREADRFIRLAGWQKGNLIAGTAEPWRPSERSAEPNGDAPKVA